MKIVFLDFDGVLNCERSNPNCYHIGEQFYPPFDVDKVKLLNTLLNEDTVLIICSSWREQLNRNQMELWLRLNDVKYYDILHMEDPRTIDKRGEAIHDFIIKLYDGYHNKYVILDDETWWYNDNEKLKSHHVVTDKAIGLTQANIDQAKAILNDD